MEKLIGLIASSLFCLLFWCPPAEVVLAGGTYSNPVYEESFQVNFQNRQTRLGIGDPTVLFYRDIYYMYATGDNHSYHVYRSVDLVHWDKGSAVFATAENGLWAPDVFFNPADEKFYLYYTVNRRLGVAVSDRPDSPFSDRGPLVANAIDAHMFLDDNHRYYLYYATYPQLYIYVQEMASPLQKKDTAPIKLLEPTQLWEKSPISVIEAPWLLKHHDVYYLLYSGGGPDSAEYAIGYATSKSPTGPFTKFQGNPMIRKEAGIHGPGHGGVTRDREGGLWLIYHQKYSPRRDWMRFIALDPLRFDEKGILHGRATRASEEAAPVTVISQTPKKNKAEPVKTPPDL